MLKKLLGLVLIIVGFVILVTPFTPGAILLIIGIDIVFGDKWLWWKRTKARILKFLNNKSS